VGTESVNERPVRSRAELIAHAKDLLAEAKAARRGQY
jgi:hypothetical protein